jgi:nucleotide-binding universal stress UspA family protein
MARKHLLIPLDGSAVSRQVLPVVRRIVEPADYAITLLRVAEEPIGFAGAPPQYVTYDHTVVPLPRSTAAATQAAHPIFQSQTEATLRDALEDELRPDAHDVAADGFEVAIEIRFGVPAEEILAVAHQEQFDLVAMATHGRSGLRRLVLGSVAEAVLRHAVVPVLLVRSGAADEDDAASSPPAA